MQECRKRRVSPFGKRLTSDEFGQPCKRQLWPHCGVFAECYERDRRHCSLDDIGVVQMGDKMPGRRPVGSPKKCEIYCRNNGPIPRSDARSTSSLWVFDYDVQRRRRTTMLPAAGGTHRRHEGRGLRCPGDCALICLKAHVECAFQ